MAGIAEPAEPAKVAASTAAREAYFVAFAKAMKAELTTMPLMVTGGFRSRAAMEYALSTGAADLIGIGRPLCGAPNACNDLLAGSAEIPHYEKHLSLLPAWLKWAEANKLVRAFAGFAIQFWYYAQIDHIGRNGEPRLPQSVFSALQQVERHSRNWLAARGVKA